MSQDARADVDADDAARLGVADLMFVLAYGPLAGGVVLLVMIGLFRARKLAELAQRTMPFAPDSDGLAFGMVAGTVLLAGLAAAAGFRARRGPLREVTAAQGALLWLAAFFATWFWLVVVGGILLSGN